MPGAANPELERLRRQRISDALRGRHQRPRSSRSPRWGVELGIAIALCAAYQSGYRHGVGDRAIRLDRQVRREAKFRVEEMTFAVR